MRQSCVLGIGVATLAVCGPASAEILRGGGSIASDCLLVLDVPGANHPAPPRTPKSVDCIDGDPTCDFDAIPGQCTFHLAACVNVVDTRTPLCDSITTQSFTIKSPSAKDALNPNKPGAAANRAALLSLLDDDGPIVLRDGRDHDCAPFDAVVIM